jgi:gamma-glutamyltranspeptidase/glutathione hydrolase
MMKKNQLKLLILCVSLQFITFSSCKNTQNNYVITKSTLGENGGIATAHPIASEIGIDVLKKGGNAVDAAIAVHFALAVVYPAAGNIGGGGFMVYRTNSGEKFALDFREKAPLAAAENMYQDDEGNIIKDLSTEGALAVGIPGAVKGMEAAFNKFSKLKNWNSLIEPSIKLAKEGFRLTRKQAKHLNDSKEKFIKNNPGLESPFTSERIYFEGDLFIQVELANTLTSIKDKGADGFYRGEVAENLVESVGEAKGIITMEDLARYDVAWRDVISFDYKDYTIHSMPPPSSGGILLAQLFNALESHEFMGFHEEKDIQIIVEAERRAYADRAHFMGDADFVDVPIAELISKEYMKNRMADFTFEKASEVDDIEHGYIESEETTHFSIVDKDGNAVSLTTTLNAAYGSKFIAKGGYLLNNEMDDFSSKVGHPNLYGLVGAEANKIEPEKRMLSSMTPTIVEKNGQLFMVIGTPGGSTIITSVFQACINVMEYEMNMNDAIQSCRFHHQWKPEEIFYEKACWDNNLIKELAVKNYGLKERSNIGRMEGILKTSSGYEIAADKRGDDHAIGF